MNCFCQFQNIIEDFLNTLDMCHSWFRYEISAGFTSIRVRVGALTNSSLREGNYCKTHDLGVIDHHGS